MATQAEAIDLLISKGNFEPQVALAIAEAVDVMMTKAQIVTVPVLDARVADLRGDIVRLDHKIDVVNASLDGKIDRVNASLEAKIDRVNANLEVVKVDLERKIEVFKMDLERKIEVVSANLEGKLGKLIESTKAELMRWVLLAMLGSGAIQAGASAFINALQNH